MTDQNPLFIGAVGSPDTFWIREHTRICDDIAVAYKGKFVTWVGFFTGIPNDLDFDGLMVAPNVWKILEPTINNLKETANGH